MRSTYNRSSAGRSDRVWNSPGAPDTYFGESGSDVGREVKFCDQTPTGSVAGMCVGVALRALTPEHLVCPSLAMGLLLCGASLPLHAGGALCLGWRAC